MIRCYSPAAANRGINLQLSPDPADHSVPIRAQSEQLLRLFTNLLINAIRHSPEGGTVSLQVSTAGKLRVAVADQGPGIPARDREQAFERFWHRSDRGGHSGLSLVISRPGLCELVVELPAPITAPEPHDFFMGMAGSCLNDHCPSFRPRPGGLRGQPHRHHPRGTG
ncbi:MAG: ATP-binding protein [Cyanobacteriota bacterium]